MSACKFRSVAPPAYPQEPHVPGQPRHRELGQVRKAKYEIWNWCLCLVTCEGNSLLLCLYISPQHRNQGRSRRRKNWTEKGAPEEGIKFTDVCLLCSCLWQAQLEALQLMMDSLPLQPGAGAPSLQGTAAQMPGSFAMLQVWPCPRLAKCKYLRASRNTNPERIPGKPFPECFQSMNCLDQSWPFK